MQNTLREALMAQATFNIDASACSTEDGSTKLCLLPGVYDTMTFTPGGDGGSKQPAITFNSPVALVKAGYAADQVADDTNLDPNFDENSQVKVEGTGRTNYRSFRNTVQRVGATVNKIIIQNKVQSQDIFDQQIEIAKTVIGAKGGMDFITLQNYVSVNAYDRSKITIDLSEEPLELTPEVFLAINVPDGAIFSIQFQFNTTVNV